MGEQTIELSQPILGMDPYVLIEAVADPADGELVLKIKAGGGVTQDEIGALPFLMITTLPTEQNPITAAITEHLDDRPEHREALTAFADALGVPMPGGEGGS